MEMSTVLTLIDFLNKRKKLRAKNIQKTLFKKKKKEKNVSVCVCVCVHMCTWRGQKAMLGAFSRAMLGAISNGPPPHPPPLTPYPTTLSLT